jgi:hypothetical protein
MCCHKPLESSRPSVSINLLAGSAQRLHAIGATHINNILIVPLIALSQELLELKHLAHLLTHLLLALDRSLSERDIHESGIDLAAVSQLRFAHWDVCVRGRLEDRDQALLLVGH